MSGSSLQPRQAGGGRLTIIALVLVFVVPLVAGVTVYFVEDLRPMGTTNYGDLVQPARPLEEMTLLQPDGAPLTVEQLRGKWTLVYISGGECDEACRERVYLLRQLRWTQGDEMRRVQRLFVVTDQAALAQMSELLEQYPGMLVASADATVMEAFVSQFEIAGAAPARDADRIYIVDPLGNLMMSYSRDADPKGIIKDLKKLLKVSQVG